MSTTNDDDDVFDVSPFLLLEASADSEAGHDDGKCANKVYDIDHDESCSASSCETSCVTSWTSQKPSRLGFDQLLEDTMKEERDAEDDGEGEVNSYIKCQRENDLAVDSGAVHVVSEMDQSRMFWEACLAS